MYIHLLIMATKCITVTTEAYERLAAHKMEKESFTDVINRIFPRRSLLELAGSLTDEETNELRAHIREIRKEIDERVERTAKELQ